MTKIILTFITIFSLLPSLSFARWTPARSLEQLEQEAGEPGRENGPSAMSNVEGIKELKLGLEPYLSEPVRYSLTSEEDNTIYDRTGTQSGATGNGSSEEASER